jgi:hypothetical protein
MNTVLNIIDNLKKQADEAVDHVRVETGKYFSAPSDPAIQHLKLALLNAAGRIQEYQDKMKQLNEAAVQRPEKAAEGRV